MKFTRFRKITAVTAAAGFTLLAVSMITGAIPASAQKPWNAPRCAAVFHDVEGKSI